jgi:dUTP pyrophosphatase
MHLAVNVIEIKFKRVFGNDDLPLPAYATAGAAGLDLRAFLPEGPVTFEHGQLRIIPVGFHVELPAGTELQIRPRSGLALKSGFIIPNSPGTIDQDFRGSVMVGLYYIGAGSYTISHGDRIAQAVIADVRRCTAIEVKHLSDTERGHGGFGSTGVN